MTACTATFIFIHTCGRCLFSTTEGARRRLIGNGIHDAEEVISIPEDWLEGLDVTNADENQYEENPWDLTTIISQMNGVITQSVTLASESVLLGVPALLVSKRGEVFSTDL